ASTSAIPVAPGERIRATAWVKCANVPPDKGTVIAIADFTEPNGIKEPAADKFGVAKIPAATKAWYKISGVAKVPPGAANLRVRLGFSYSQGTCWWDDVTVWPE